ncbi:MAG TPA: DUF444 family protein [Patescibacteria group bacterium]
MTKDADIRPSLVRLGTGKDYLENNAFAKRPDHPVINAEGDKWSLRREAEIDAKRHDTKAKEALAKKLGEVLSEPGMDIMDGKRKITVRYKPQLVEYKFRFGQKGEVGVGSGNGKSKVGDILGKDAQGQGQGQGAGEGGEGEAEFDHAEASINEVLRYTFEDLELPRSNRAGQNRDQGIQFTDVRKAGPLGNLDKRRTFRENIKRNAMHGDARLKDVKNEDLRFKVWENNANKQIGAVVMVMLDVSTSMTKDQLRAAKAAARLQYLFLKTKYPDVDMVCIAHANQTRVFEKGNLDEFWTVVGGLGGGTDAYAAFNTANQLVKDRFNPNEYDIFGLYLGDGEDNPHKEKELVEGASEFFENALQLGFGEVGNQNSWGKNLRGRLKHAAGHKNKEKYKPVWLADESHAIDVLRALYQKGGKRVA